MPEFELFSDSDEERKKRRSSFKKNKKSASECSESEHKHSESGNRTKLDESTTDEQSKDIPDNIKENYTFISLKKINLIPVNTLICYKKKNGKVITNKYYKSYDIIKKEINIGFYSSNDRRNYSQPIIDIQELYANIKSGGNVVGGAKKADDKLKETVIISQENWDKIVPDTIISYRKKDQSMVYNAKFNSYVITKKDNLSKMALLSSTGQSFLANPLKIETIYRHFTSKDKTLAQILQNIKSLEARIIKLEQGR